jgi:hypothetical protein
MWDGTQPDQRNVARFTERGPVNGVLVSMSSLTLLYASKAFGAGHGAPGPSSCGVVYGIIRYRCIAGLTPQKCCSEVQERQAFQL